jgi:cellulose biosynthesis protein BcsQ
MKEVAPQNGFGKRFKEAFGNRQNYEIAELLGLSDSAITTYVAGRVPAADKLIKISKITNCNLHWLLTGEGEKEFKEYKKPTSLFFFGSGGGVGITTACLNVAFILAEKGKRVLLVENEMGGCISYLISRNTADKWSKKIERKRSVGGIASAFSRKIITEISGIDIFVPTGMRIDENEYQNVNLQKLANKTSTIARDYDYIIFDVHLNPDPFDEFYIWNNTVPLKDFYTDAKVIVSCSPDRYPAKHYVQNAINCIENAKKEIAGLTLLGIFFNKVSSYRGRQSARKLRLDETAAFFGEKMLKTIIEHDVNSAALMCTNLKKYISKKNTSKKNTLLENYKQLVNEIEERISETDKLI